MWGKSFSQELYLIRHLRIYTVEKPYELYVCGKAFECFESEKSNRNLYLIVYLKIYSTEKHYENVKAFKKNLKFMKHK